MSETSRHSGDPGALARHLVRRLLLDRDLAGAAAAGPGPAGPLADDWMLQELCAVGRGSGARWRRRECWRTLLTDTAGPGSPAH